MSSTGQGKLTNKDSGESLSFTLTPTEYRLSRHYDFSVQSCLGQSAPQVEYQSGSATQLSVQIIFDKDIDKEFSHQSLEKFIRLLNKINPSTQSVPLVEFALGHLIFRGYVSSFLLSARRFDSKLALAAAVLDLTILSNGEYENAT